VQLVLIPPHNFGVGHLVISGFRKLGRCCKKIYAVNNVHLSIIIIIITMIIMIIITWTIPDGKTHNQSDHILIERRWHSCMLDVRSFRGADFDIVHSLVVAKVRERLTVSKQETQ
jgi:hypothetical protein